MHCTTHFLNLTWSHHNWKREVTRTESLSFQEADMWGRRYGVDHVLCHIQLVCRDCHATKDGGDCGCEPDQGARCPARLEYFERVIPAS